MQYKKSKLFIMLMIVQHDYPENHGLKWDNKRVVCPFIADYVLSCSWNSQKGRVE